LSTNKKEHKQVKNKVKMAKSQNKTAQKVKSVTAKSAEVKSVVKVPLTPTTPISEGATIPQVTWKTRTRIESDDANPFDWKDLSSADLFKGKRIVVFSLPGAFTPTCSSTHLPGYEKHYEDMLKLGVDDVYCISVNDAFVMRQWGLHQGLEEDKTVGSLGFKKVKLLPDGACLFTRGMGMSCTWDTERGFGERSWRYSAVINDQKVEKLFIEPRRVQNSGPDPFEVSDADTMFAYLSK